MQIKNLIVTAAVAGFSAIALAAPYAPTRAEGERCMGADGYAAVEWIPCADGLECVEDVAKGYGKFCEKPAYRVEGARCKGADGNAGVEWIPCTDGLECAEDAAMGYGSFCKKPAFRKEGDRCKGAAGYAAVEWIACMDGLECVEDAAMGYGSFCKRPQDSATPTTAAPTTVPVMAAPVCAANWETCGGRGGGDQSCCDPTFECVDAVEDGYWGLRCQPKGSSY
jgi:hypothetical protein